MRADSTGARPRRADRGAEAPVDGDSPLTSKRPNDAAEKAATAQQAWNEQLRAFRNLVGIRQMEDARAAMDAQAKQIEVNVELEFELNKMYQANAAKLGALCRERRPLYRAVGRLRHAGAGARPQHHE